MNNAFETTFGRSAAESSAEERVAFVRKTYAHLAGAVLAFVVIEYLLLNSPIAEPLIGTMLGTSYSWLIVLGLFMGVSFLANWWANSQTSPAMQYLGLGLFVVAQAIVFLPLLYIANLNVEGAIPNAAMVTLSLFAALTAIVFTREKTFRF